MSELCEPRGIQSYPTTTQDLPYILSETCLILDMIVPASFELPLTAKSKWRDS
jgi:hypothetical protein